MIFILRFLRGVLRISVKGDSPQRILTLSARNGISLWDLRIANSEMDANIYIKDFFSLPQILRKTGLKVHISDKKGLPFILRKNRFRFGFFTGMVALFFFLQIMSGYIWIIDVSGNQKVKSEEIIKACNDIGLYVGIRTKDINPKILREKLLLNAEGLAW